MKQVLKSNKGEAMIEAALYFPVLLIIVFFFIYISIMKVQNALIEFQTDKTADQAAKSIMYDGYDEFGGAKDTSLSLKVTMPNQAQVSNYYKNKQTKAYLFQFEEVNSQAYKGMLSTMADNHNILNRGNYGSPTLYENGQYMSKINAYYSFSNAKPGLFRKLTYNDVHMFSFSGSSAERPADFIRITDITSDSHLENQRWIDPFYLREKLIELGNEISL